MERRWYQAYIELRNLVAEHPEIKVTDRVVAIPENLRPEFYHLFNRTRILFVQEHLPNLPKETNPLGKNYVKAEQDVKRLLGLEEISIATDLREFLKDPNGRLTRELFNPLFNLLKQQIEVEAFEKEGTRTLRSSYGELYQRVYQKWVVLALVKLFKANKLFSVAVPSLEMTPRGPKIVVDPQPVPHPQESRHLTFLHDTTPGFIAPDFIIYSPRIMRFVAFRTEIGDLDSTAESMWKASERSAEREWYCLKVFKPFWEKYGAFGLRSDLIMNLHERMEDLVLIADAETFCRPDLVLVSMGREDPLEKLLQKKNLYQRFLHPKFGTFIVCMEPLEKSAQLEWEESAYGLPVGFRQNQLSPIFRILEGK
ncbi:MAG: hypothetical protein ACE144_09780 [Thermodesulfobacteriota bacterium]